MIVTILLTVLAVHLFWGAVVLVYFYLVSRDPQRPRIVR